MAFRVGGVLGGSGVGCGCDISVGYYSGFRGGFVVGVKPGGLGGFSFTVPGSDSVMLVFLGFVFVLVESFRDYRVFIRSSSCGVYRRF